MQTKSIGIDLGKTTFHLVALGIPFPSVGSKEVSRQHYWPTWRICPRRTQRRCAITVCANTDRRVTRSQIFFLLLCSQCQRLSESEAHQIGFASRRSLPRHLYRVSHGCFGVVGLGVVAEEAIANAAVAPTSAPRIAKPMFLYVYENVTPMMLIACREPPAKASFGATLARSRLGTTMPAMNKVITNSISS